MKKFLLFFAVFVSIALSLKYTALTQAQTKTPQVSPNIVISQLFVGGGLANAPYQNDYVELFNRGSASVNLSNWSVQYAAAGSNFSASTTVNATIPAGGYFLVKEASGGAVGAICIRDREQLAARLSAAQF